MCIRDSFADNGLPELTNETTYEELLDMVKTLHDNGLTTFAQGAMTNYSVWGYLCLLYTSRWAREERRSDTGFNRCEIARDGALDVFFRKCCVFAFRIHIPFLSA